MAADLPNYNVKTVFALFYVLFGKYLVLDQSVIRAWQYWIMYPQTGLAPGQIEKYLQNYDFVWF